jgi:uncharacterized protein (DUF488 family)
MKRPMKLPSNSTKTKKLNKELWNDSRSSKEADFYTIGYEGRKIEQFLKLLQDAEIKTLLDIRHTPVSMYRPEISKKNISKSVEAIGIHYLHKPELGVPRDIRARAIESGDREVIWEWYDIAVVDSFFSKNLHWFLNIEHPVALMCVEADPTECHRHRIFFELEKHKIFGFDL